MYNFNYNWKTATEITLSQSHVKHLWASALSGLWCVVLSGVCRRSDEDDEDDDDDDDAVTVSVAASYCM